MAQYTTGQLFALVALAGGDVSKAAELINVDEDVLQSAVDEQKLPLRLQRDLERSIEDYKDENAREAETIDRVSDLLDNWYPELKEIFWNDGIAEKLVERPEFIDIFYKDPTKWTEDGKTYSNGGLYPGAIEVIINWAKSTKEGKPRKKGQADLSPMIEALEEDDYEIGYIDDSAFWRWFRGIYPG